MIIDLWTLGNFCVLPDNMVEYTGVAGGEGYI